MLKRRQNAFVIASALGAATVLARPSSANPNLTKASGRTSRLPGDHRRPRNLHRARHRDRSQEPLHDLLGHHAVHQFAGGLFKSTDGGSTWAKIAKVTPLFQGASDHLDMPLHVRIDPNDSNHLYAGDGVRGSSTGFFVSTDGGDQLRQAQGFVDALKAATIDNQDIYDVAADPSDFKHLLLASTTAWGWTDTKWNTNAGVLESKDGGNTWIVHEPRPGWGAGHAIKFLYNPALGIGNSQTWLLGTQGAAIWRTTDSRRDLDAR